MASFMVCDKGAEYVCMINGANLIYTSTDSWDSLLFHCNPWNTFFRDQWDTRRFLPRTSKLPCQQLVHWSAQSLLRETLKPP